MDNIIIATVSIVEAKQKEEHAHGFVFMFFNESSPLGIT
jgi:hypothetical protein